MDVAPARRPCAWALGPPEDAVAVALAFHHAWGDPVTADIAVYLSDAPEPAGDLSFRPSDTRCIPTSRLDEAFLHRDHRWVAKERVTRRVRLGRPRQPVDFLTIRIRTVPRAGLATVPSALDSVRRDGRILFDETPPDGLLDPGRFRPAGGSGRLFERTADPAPVESGF